MQQVIFLLCAWFVGIMGVIYFGHLKIGRIMKNHRHANQTVFAALFIHASVIASTAGLVVGLACLMGNNWASHTPPPHDSAAVVLGCFVCAGALFFTLPIFRAIMDKRDKIMLKNNSL